MYPDAINAQPSFLRGSDEEGDQVLGFDVIERICKRLNENITAVELINYSRFLFCFPVAFPKVRWSFIRK